MSNTIFIISMQPLFSQELPGRRADELKSVSSLLSAKNSLKERVQLLSKARTNSKNINKYEL